MAGNTNATSGTIPQSGQPMFRQGSVLGGMFPNAQSLNSADIGATLARLVGFGV